MSLPLSSTDDLYNLFITTVQNEAPQLTDTLDGAVLDALAGCFAVAGSEIQRNTIVQLTKTFFNSANGPEITGGHDDLATLATDHFGENFERPQAIAAIDTVTFSRANNNAGACTILAGSIVKTQPDANGNQQRYATQNDVTLLNTGSGAGLSISVSVLAVIAGAAGSAGANTITSIETVLTDSSIVVTNVGNATGEDAQDDATYRETIRNLIEAIAGATLQAVQASAKTVAGVVSATAVEAAMTVIQWNPATSTPIGTYFYIPRATLYIADATGTASPALIAAVVAKLRGVKACGVFINVAAAQSQTVNWTGSYVLNPMGPNYTTLLSDSSILVTAMQNYINNLPTGTNFIRATANAAILAIYGAAGTNDLTAFTTSVPSGDVSAGTNVKFVAGTVGTV